MHYLFLCPLCLALAAWFIVVERAERYVEADVIKGAASLCFVLLGVLGAGSLADPYRRMVVLGLTVGAIADVVLNLRYVFEGAKGKIAFLAGILVFLAGHVVYLVALAPRCGNLPFAVVVGLVLTAVLMRWILGQIEAELAFKVFGVFYVGAVTVMCSVAFACLMATPNAHTMHFAAGAALFLVSDIILILNTFGPKKSFVMRVSNLMLYYIGQLLIALSLQLV